LRYQVVQLQVVGTGARNPDSHGYAVFDTRKEQLTSVHPYSLHAEAIEEADAHEEWATILDHWPESDDHELRQLVTEPEFRLDEQETFAYRMYRASERIARQRAGLPEPDAV